MAGDSVALTGGAAWLPMRAAPGRWLAMGLQWAPILEADARTQLRRRARTARATHCVLGESAMGGWLRLPRAMRQASVHAAALAYARLNPLGSSVAMLALPDGRIWVAAAHAGAVLADGDRICADEGEAIRLRDALQARFPGMAQTSVSWDELAGPAGEDTRLERLSGAWRRLPLPLKVVPLMLLVVYGAQHGGSVWRLLAGPPPEPPAIDAGAAWAQAQAAAARAHPVHGAGDMRAVLSGLSGLPADAAGWSLRTATCRASASAWDCRADYARTGHGARNAELLRRAPAGWDVEFGLLDQAVLSWRIAAGGGSLADLDAAGLPRGRDTEQVYASHLQGIRPAFGLIGVGAASDLPVPAPGDAQGAPLARPADLAVLRTRPFSIHGPLRSYVLLAEAPPPMAWRELSLELAPERAAGIALSRLAVRLQGVLYEQR